MANLPAAFVCFTLVCLLLLLVDISGAASTQKVTGEKTDTNEKAPIRVSGADKGQESTSNKLTIRYETKWFRQPVDHFSWANQDTWLQRYLVNKERWCGQNCPILFYTGNEGDIEVFTNNTGWMWENADRLHAMLVFAEHRFYGKSMPYQVDFRRTRFNQTKTLGYLSSEQALADYARLIFELKNNIFDAKHSPVITLGGSYGGMLAAWMRMKYPNLVDGALAGSAPILQFPGEYNCHDFYTITTKDYEGYSENCSRSIAMSWSKIGEMASIPGGLAKLSKHFNTCQQMSEADVGTLIDVLGAIWVNMAMTDYANEASFLSNLPAHPIEHACAHLKADPVDLSDDQLLAAISKASQIYTNYTGKKACFKMEEYTSDPVDFLWDFQSCTEMVMPICADGVNDMFYPIPFNVNDFVLNCRRRWGVETQVNKIRTLYGDRNLSSASKIIFSSCSRDPWSAGCPRESIDANQIFAIECPGAHHEDLRPSGPNDSAAMNKVRQRELDIITNWIQTHYSNVKKLAPGETLIWANRTSNL